VLFAAALVDAFVDELLDILEEVAVVVATAAVVVAFVVEVEEVVPFVSLVLVLESVVVDNALVVVCTCKVSCGFRREEEEERRGKLDELTEVVV